MRKQQDQYAVASHIIADQLITRDEPVSDDGKHRNRQEKHGHTKQKNHRPITVSSDGAHQHDKNIEENQLHHDHQADVDLGREQSAANHKSSDLNAYLNREYTKHHPVCADRAFAGKKRVDIGQEKAER